MIAVRADSLSACLSLHAKHDERTDFGSCTRYNLQPHIFIYIMAKQKPLIHNKRRNKIRLHHEGTHTLLYVGALSLLVICLAWFSRPTLSYGSYFIISVVLVMYGILLNFFRCPIRMFNGPTHKSVVAPADGHVVVIEEVEEEEYFHDKRLMVSIFMSLTNVHANWIPCEGTIVNHTTLFRPRLLQVFSPLRCRCHSRGYVQCRQHGIDRCALSQWHHALHSEPSAPQP